MGEKVSKELIRALLLRVMQRGIERIEAGEDPVAVAREISERMTRLRSQAEDDDAER